MKEQGNWWNNEAYSKGILLLLTIGFLLYFYADVIFSPNSYLFDKSGDGMKNYFTYMTQSQALSYTESTAMNYPYGENFLYLDCHPSFTIVLKVISKVAPMILDYRVGIVNLCMIFSMVLAAWFLYLVLRKYSVAPIVSAVSAFSIMVLSPQVFRMTGHYALSYGCFIPITWYFYLRYRESVRSWIWSIALCLNALFWFYVHAYLGMIAVAFTTLLFTADYVFEFKKNCKNLSLYRNFLIQTPLPLIVFWGVAHALDSHTGRTTNPYGYMQYTSDFSSVFLPHHPPLKPLLENFMTIDQLWEGWAYIGVISVVAIVIALIRWGKRVILSGSNFYSSHSRSMNAALFAAVMMLLISFGYPFKWRMEWLLDKVDIIKNFRGIGRFAWVFYFVITVFTVKFFYELFHANSSKRSMIGLLPVIMPLGYLVEGLPYHQENSTAITRSANLFRADQADASFTEVLSNISPEKYQSIISLPYFHIGSENFGKSGTDKSYRLSMLLGYYTRLPLMANYSTRTSIEEAKRLMQLISPPIYTKEIQQDLHDHRPFLILYTHEELTEWESDLLHRATLVYENEECQIREISYNELFRNYSQQWLDSYHAIKNNLVEKNGFWLQPADSNTYLYFNSFDEYPQPIHLSGEGSLSELKQRYCLLKKFDPQELMAGKIYNASFWIYNQGKNHGQDVASSMIFIDVKYADGRQEWKDVKGINGSYSIDGDWSMEEYVFTAPENALEYAIYLKGPEHSEIRYYVDDLLIREVGVDVYQSGYTPSGKERLFLNNHRVLQP